MKEFLRSLLLLLARDHRLQGCRVCLREVSVEKTAVLVLIRAVWRSAFLAGALAVFLEGRSESGTVLAETTVVVQGAHCPLVNVEQATRRLGGQCPPQVLLTTGGARRRVASGSSALGGVGSGEGGDHEERRGCLLNGLVRVVDAADERVDKLVSRAQREPLDEQLVDVALRQLEPHVSRELTAAQLVHDAPSVCVLP